MMWRLKIWLASERGSAAAEFGMIVPVFFLAVFGVFHLCFAVYAASALHWTVEQSARCAVMSRLYSSAPAGDSSLGCQTISTTKSYALSLYKGPGIQLSTASFTPSEDNGNQCRKVTGSGTYQIRLGLVNVDVPITARACFPTVVNPSAPWT